MLRTYLRVPNAEVNVIAENDDEHQRQKKLYLDRLLLLFAPHQNKRRNRQECNCRTCEEKCSTE